LLFNTKEKQNFPVLGCIRTRATFPFRPRLVHLPRKLQRHRVLENRVCILISDLLHAANHARFFHKTHKSVSLLFSLQDQTVIARLQTQGAVCIESFKDFAQMGRFTLRDEGRTIAIGKVLKIIE